MPKNVRELYDSPLPHRAVTVWMYLKGRADNKTDECFPSIRTIGRELKLSRSTVKRALDDLVKSGCIAKNDRWRDNGGRSSNLYKLLE